MEDDEQGAGVGVDDDDDGEEEGANPVPGALLVSLTTACGVLLVLSLIWIASRWTAKCRRVAVQQQHHPLTQQHYPSGCRSHHLSGRTRSSLWEWMQQQQQQHHRRRREEEENGRIDGSSAIYDRVDPSGSISGSGGGGGEGGGNQSALSSPDREALIAHRRLSDSQVRRHKISLSFLGTTKKSQKLKTRLTSTKGPFSLNYV